MPESHTDAIVAAIVAAIVIPLALMTLIACCCCCWGHFKNRPRKRRQSCPRHRLAQRQCRCVVTPGSCSSASTGGDRPRNWGWIGQNKDYTTYPYRSYNWNYPCGNYEYSYNGWLDGAATPTPGRVYHVYPNGWVEPVGYQKV